MPTAAKLVAAICLAIVGYLASEAIRPLMPESTNFGYFNWVNVGLGIAVGWIVMGKRAGRGFANAVSNGLTGAAALTAWGLFVQATNEMVDRSFRRFYDSPFEAIAAIFELALEYGAFLGDMRVIAILVFGGLITGFLAEFAAKRWR